MDRQLRIVLLALAVAFWGLSASIGEQPAPAPGAAAGHDLGGASPSGPSSPWPAAKETPVAVPSLPPTTANRSATPPQEFPPPDASPLPQASPLKHVEPQQERSEQIEQIARQADERTRHGFELAARGAYFAARAEFVAGLRMIAEGLDTEQRTSVHSRALAAALTAIKEAEAFLPRGSRLEADLDVATIVATHATPVLKSFVVPPSGGREDDRSEPAKAGTTNDATPMMALRCYLTFAQEQLSVAAGHEVAGSMSLYALGKLHDALAQTKSDREVAAGSKAMVYYQASLLVDPENFMATNDLGVLLARSGDYRHARLVLERSIALKPHSTTWHSLAVVYQQLGETALAQGADRQCAAAQQIELAQRKNVLGTSTEGLRWLDPQTFAQTSINTPNSPGATVAPPAQAAGVPVESGRLPPEGQAAAGNAPGAKTARSSPAPTPAAAQREAWGSSPYQR